MNLVLRWGERHRLGPAARLARRCLLGLDGEQERALRWLRSETPLLVDVAFFSLSLFLTILSMDINGMTDVLRPISELNVLVNYGLLSDLCAVIDETIC